MKKTKKSRLKNAEVADNLFDAIKLFMNGQASPESLYVINSGVCSVLRELIETERVSPNDEYVLAFLDLYQSEMIKTRTLIENKRRGLQ